MAKQQPLVDRQVSVSEQKPQAAVGRQRRTQANSPWTSKRRRRGSNAGRLNLARRSASHREIHPCSRGGASGEQGPQVQESDRRGSNPMTPPRRSS